jgi:hypothetical protein
MNTDLFHMAIGVLVGHECQLYGRRLMVKFTSGLSKEAFDALSESLPQGTLSQHHLDGLAAWAHDWGQTVATVDEDGHHQEYSIDELLAFLTEHVDEFSVLDIPHVDIKVFVDSPGASFETTITLGKSDLSVFLQMVRDHNGELSRDDADRLISRLTSPPPNLVRFVNILEGFTLTVVDHMDE